MYLKEQKIKEEWELSLLLLRWIKHDSANQLGFKFDWVSLKNLVVACYNKFPHTTTKWPLPRLNMEAASSRVRDIVPITFTLNVACMQNRVVKQLVFWE